MNNILEEIEHIFHLKLDEKTNWGKEQVKKLYADASLEVLRKLFTNNESGKH